MLFDRMKPAKMLPNINRLMALIRDGLFSLIKISVVDRGWPIKA